MLGVARPAFCTLPGNTCGAARKALGTVTPEAMIGAFLGWKAVLVMVLSSFSGADWWALTPRSAAAEAGAAVWRSLAIGARGDASVGGVVTVRVM